MQSDSTSIYFRNNIKVEPLIDRWYAWTHLISPATAARNLTERHLKIIDSYIQDPDLHAAAVRNPRMLGGPFMDYEGSQVQGVRALRTQTIAKRGDHIQLSNAIAQLDAMLRNEAKGLSIEPLYARIPPLLRGYVELVYDLNDHASFRLIEPLLYRSRYYARDAQSLLLSQIAADERPFVLSTPRLHFDGALHLAVPFEHEAIDALFRSKTESCPMGQIRDLIVPFIQGDAPDLSSLFTPDPPRPYAHYEGSGVRWRYFGHACILIETRGVTMLLDPVLSYTYEHHISRYTYDDLPDKLDYVLITHNHQDHVLLETLLQLRHKIGCIVTPRSSGGDLQDPSLRLLLRALGFRNVIELGELETLDGGEVSIMGLPFFGEHADLDIRSKLAYLVNTGKHKLLFVADSCNIEPSLYHHLTAETGGVDALFIGMECDGAPMSWLYGPLFTRPVPRASDGSRRLAGSDCRQALDVVRTLNCKEVYVYAMGQEPWLSFISSIRYTEQSRPILESNRLLQMCADRRIVAERLFGEKEILIEN